MPTIELVLEGSRNLNSHMPLGLEVVHDKAKAEKAD